MEDEIISKRYELKDHTFPQYKIKRKNNFNIKIYFKVQTCLQNTSDSTRKVWFKLYNYKQFESSGLVSFLDFQVSFWPPLFLLTAIFKYIRVVGNILEEAMAADCWDKMRSLGLWKALHHLTFPNVDSKQAIKMRKKNIFRLSLYILVGLVN